MEGSLTRDLGALIGFTQAEEQFAEREYEFEGRVEIEAEEYVRSGMTRIEGEYAAAMQVSEIWSESDERAAILAWEKMLKKRWAPGTELLL